MGPLPYYALIYPVDRTILSDLAYSFQYAHTDDRDPDTYVAPLREAIQAWRAAHPEGFRTLRYRRGPGFLLVQDGRPHSERANYTFGEREAAIYLACEDGATAAQACEAARAAGASDISVDEVREFLDDLQAARLIYGEDGRYLALALPWRLPEAA